jgi:pimeloyl-ACP methyl ester carboxylesterase
MFREVNGHLLNVVSFGEGAPTLLAHGGWVGNWELWQQPFEILARSWRCVAYDHRGAGESVVALDQITPEGLIDDVFGVMDAVGIERCILAGESLGAVVVLGAALRHPGRFDGLVVVDGAPAVTEAARPLVDGAHTDYPATVQWFIDACVPEPDSEHIRRWGRNILLRADAAAAARMLECYLERDDPPLALAEISVPTLVMHGSQDFIVPLDIGISTASQIPGATLVTLDGAGHVPTLTRPHDVARALMERFGTSDDRR